MNPIMMFLVFSYHREKRRKNKKKISNYSHNLHNWEFIHNRNLMINYDHGTYALTSKSVFHMKLLLL